MLNKLLYFLYVKYRPRFHSFMVEETVGVVPKEIKDASAEFFRRAGVGFEKFLMWHAYLLHKKMMDTPKKADFYEGAISNVRYYQLLCAQGKMEEPKKVEPKEPIKEDPLIGVRDFTQKMKRVVK